MKLLLFAAIAVLLLLSCTGVTGFTADHGATVYRRTRQIVDVSMELLELEEEAAAAVYPHRRVLQGNGKHIGYGALNQNNAACGNSCPGRGDGYTAGRGCNPKYGCVPHN